MDVEKQPQKPSEQPEETEAATTDDERLELQVKKEGIQLIEKNGANGGNAPDTKIKIAEPEKAFSGMSKDELMKYANDPFWVRLRWFLFIVFWVVWLAMLIGAILIIVYAPKCAATEKLSWWQAGPLAVVDPSDPPTAAQLNAIDATGLVYKVPADDTYSPEKMSAHKKAIEELAATHHAKVIVDLVANYVADTDDLFLQALVDKKQRAPFVWVERPSVPNNWLAINGGSAWRLQNDSSYVLSQFADNRYDLQMNHAENKERLKKVLRDYGRLSAVCGFRLANTQHFIVDPAGALKDEEAATAKNGGAFGHDDYHFWTHTQTTYGAGLSDLLADFKATALNATADHCAGGSFFGASNALEFVDLYAQNGRLTVEAVPVKLNLFQKRPKATEEPAEAIVRELKSLRELTSKGLYVEHQYETPSSEQLLFTVLLPRGVPAIAKQQLAADADQKEASLKLANVLALRNSPSFSQGSFEVHQDAGKQLVAYTRVKAGSPGYLVVYNPTEAAVRGNFNGTGIATDLTVAVVSENYKEEGITLKHKLFANEIPVSAQSVAILTFVQDAAQ